MGRNITESFFMVCGVMSIV